jgi:DNA helicase-2/ATP-dependent DNA helicase PcrA
MYRFKKIEGIEKIADEGSNWSMAAKILRYVNGVAEEAIELEHLKKNSDVILQVLGETTELYRKTLHEKRKGSLDFSIIQLECLKLLRDNPSVLEELNERLQYLMVDEYQDTNPIQEKLLFLLAGKKRNICVVGDDDQGLYRFRGATIKNILDFPKKFTKNTCRQIELDTNYRSHEGIISFYNKWQEGLEFWEDENTQYRYDKKIKAPKDKIFPNVNPVAKIEVGEGESWNEKILEFIKSFKESGNIEDLNQIAFLFKSVKNDKVLKLANFLEENGIAVHSPRSNLFFDREEVKLMIGALLFMFPQVISDIEKKNQEHEQALYNYYIDHCFKPLANQLGKPENVELLNFLREKANAHVAMTKDAPYAFSGLFYELLQYPLFSRYIDEHHLEYYTERPIRNLALISRLLTKFEYIHYTSVFKPKYLKQTLKSFFESFFRYLYTEGLNEYEDNSEYAPKGCVSFLTIHQSKGLEFPVVIVGSLWDTPRADNSEVSKSLEASRLTIESFEPNEYIKYFDFWRLYYTAFSRAQNYLILTCPSKEEGSRGVSKAFREIFRKLPDWSKDDLCKIKFDLVKEVNLKNEYSFTSHINLFENCAQQYRFFKEFEFNPVRTSPMIFGTVVHQTIDDIHKSVLIGEIDSIDKNKIEEWFYDNYRNISQTERILLPEGHLNAALEHILRYYKNESDKWNRIQSSEIDVNHVEDGFILKGTVDLVYDDNDSLQIIDFKSEKKPDFVLERDRLERHKKQLEVYAYLLEKKYDINVSKMSLYFTGAENENPYVDFKKNIESIDNTINSFKETVLKIEKKDFSIEERPAKLCRDCDLRRYCDRKYL